jgi:membrane protease YdiL (CAAX protease family)
MTASTVDHPPARGFFNSTPVRFFIFSVSLIALDIGAQFALALASRRLPRLDPGLMTASVILPACVLLLLLYAGLVRVLERRKPSELALDPGAGLAVAGAAGGVLLFSLVMATFFALGVARLAGGGDSSEIVVMALMAALAAFAEELAIRGGVFRILEEGLGSLAALVLSALLFGCMHLVNPGATLVSAASIAVLGGLLLAAAYMATRSLWLPIGIHFGFNFAESGIFGATLSGVQSHGGIWPVSIHGPQLLSGGAFGPEASVVTVTINGLATVALLIVAVRRGEWRPLRLRLWAA